MFDPTDLSEELTPAACRRALAQQSHARAMLIALRLNDQGLLRHCVSAPPGQGRGQGLVV